MKRIILLSIALVISTFARTETIELTGEYSEQLGNSFKKILNKNKTKTINIFSEDKEIMLNVDTNLNEDIFSVRMQHPDKIILKNKNIENVVEDFYSEYFNVKHLKKDAVILNIQSGSVYLNYINPEHNMHNHFNEIEVTLNISLNGKEKKLVMNHTLGKEEVGYEDFLTTEDFDFKTLKINTTVPLIIENMIYKALRSEND